MLLFSPALASQISSLFHSLTTANYQSVLNGLRQVIEYGIDGCILLLQTCLEQIKVQDVDTPAMQLKLNMVSVVFRCLLDRPNFSTIFCQSLRTQVTENFLEDLAKALNLSIPEKIGIGLALSDCDDIDARLTGQNFCMIQIQDLYANPSSMASYDGIQNVIMFLYQCEGLSKHVDGFLATLSVMKMKENTTFLLSPVLTDVSKEPGSLRGVDSFSETNDHDFDALLTEMQKEISIADIVKELGYDCTLSVPHCKEILALHHSPLDEAAVAKIISTVVCTHTGREDSQNVYAAFCAALGNSSMDDSSWMNSWSIDVVINTINQIAPETNWTSVMENLDHEGFYLPDEKSFSLLMSVYRNACEEPFPLHAVTGAIWKNTEGQLSFLKYAISAPPDMFTFSHATRQLSYMDLPQGNMVPQIAPNQSWISLDLLQVLCELAERGHASTVRTLLEYPLNHCPDILLVGVAQLNTAFNLIQYELFCTIFPIVVRNGPKNGCIHQLWLVNHDLVVRGFLDMHSNEPDSSLGILEICHELKILNSVLDMSPLSFSIKLAVLASTKGHLDLERWLDEKLSIFQDAFFEGCLKFLKERVVFGAATDANPFQHSDSDSSVSQEILSTFLKTLQAYPRKLVSRQLFEEMQKLHTATVQENPGLQSSGVTESSPPRGYSDEIEAEANSYFHQLFEDQLPMDSMIQMLARFGKSSDPRERAIADCMIHNLFDEYKFFHRYPERQLKITAVLFGSLIKHQLLSRITLGVALRFILDSLHKSVDSKMFLFGSKALEQFMDRLEEYPQYCNHILQISHLHATHSELISYIERILARILPSQSESVGGNNVATDQSQNNVSQDSMEKVEILNSVLDMSPLSFSIKLAVLASTKGHLDLERWLDEKLSIFQDAFFEGCLKFLKERVVFGAATDANPFQHSDSDSSVSQEILSTFLKTLQAYPRKLVSRQLFEEMQKLHTATVQENPGLQSSGVTESSPPRGYSDEIEAEANSYFHQLFEDQLPMDSMIQMLARFGKSSDPRERAIADCMIHNLFDEYKFFHRYPERQLKITAVLFGSLIKHQLLSRITLGVALRFILDSLHKSVDSKMFLFGSKALEQFMDRLEEYPQYCNHILQISHLHATHSELISYIERILARILPSQSESVGGNNVATDQSQNNVSQDSMEKVELNVSTGSQALPHLSASQQLQQRQLNYLDDRHKTSSAPGTHIKPPYPSGLGGSVANGVDLDTRQKSTGSQSSQSVITSQPSTSGTATVLSSTSLPRSSRVPLSAGVLRQPLSFGAPLNIETLVAAAERRETPIEAPPSEVQDKIFFMINNISSNNVETKAKEFVEILKEQFYTWFGQYMVMKRASIEPNFHDLYLKFLDKVNSRSLNKEIIKATYENCKVLLRSELIKSSSEERSLLKNLGSWLGKFTIGRNQALRAREIDPKQLIIEAYERGLMIAVIPFTSKVLEPCQSSLAYQPPNPWTMAILGLLAEIHALPNLKMNLKFDIEMLFKNLGVDMKDVKPTSLLKHRVREVEGNPDFSNKDPGLSQPQVTAELSSGIIPSLGQVELQPDLVISSHPSGHSNYASSRHLTSGILSEDDQIGNMVLPERLPAAQGLSQVALTQPQFPGNQLSLSIPNVGTHVIVNQKLSAISQQWQLQRIVPLAMETAIGDIITPVIERSTDIACLTTKELVSKDYAMESDEGRTHDAASRMVASLAGSMAHVTCKEPLRIAMSNKLRQYLQHVNVSNDVLEQVVQIATSDNLDLGCAVIEKIAIEKADIRIKNELADLLSTRSQHEGLGAAFYEASMYSQGNLARLPEGLRPKPGRVSAAQHQVYMDFDQYLWQSQTTQSSSAISSIQPASSCGFGGSGLSHPYACGSVQMNSNMYSATQLTTGFSSMVQSIDQNPDELEYSISSGHTGTTDGVIQSVSESSALTTLSLPAAITEVPAAEASSVKDSLPLLPQLPHCAERLGTGMHEPLNMGDALAKYEAVTQKLENLVSKDAKDTEVQAVIAEVPEIITRCVSKDEAAMTIAQKVFKNLYEYSSNSVLVSFNLAILVAIRDVCKLVVKELTSWVIYSADERKYNKDIIFGLIRTDLLNLAEYNLSLAKLIDGGKNKPATDFAIALVQSLVSQELSVSTSEFQPLLDSLGKLSMRTGLPESFQQLVETARNPSNITSQSAVVGGSVDKARFIHDKKVQPLGRAVAGREGTHLVTFEAGATDSAVLRDQVNLVYKEWFRLCETPGRDEASYLSHLSLWQQRGVLKGDEVSEGFFRMFTEFVVSACLSSEMNSSMLIPLQAQQNVSNLIFTTIDVYAKLVFFLVKYYAAEQGPNKFLLFPKVLSATVKSIHKDAEEKRGSFNARPYYRLFINWIFDFNSAYPIIDGINFQIWVALANAFHALQPLKVPGFSFVWLELVSHRCFMPKLLTSNSPKGWPFIQKLLVGVFKYLEPYLKTVELNEPVHFLYRGTLRVLLVLLHDFPEFLCDYHFSFCDIIPPTCVQMRNVILSAFPRNMRLPDPFTPSLKVDLIPDISQPPRILSDVDGALKAKQIKANLDEYLKTRQPGSTFLTELKQKLMLSQNEASLAGTRYNVPLINSLALYVGMQEIQQMQSKPAQQPVVPTQRMTNSACIDIFQKMIVDLDTEGRYLFINALANQLRYPNNHTHFFSCAILFLFAEANQEIIQEQITRVLLERLIVNRPHPWGLLVTFIELINLWSKPFTRTVPEIERLFDSVARSCGGLPLKSAEESLDSSH